MRAVLDVNVLVAALLSRDGTPARLVSGWLRGDFELIVSELLLGELARALAYPKLQARVPADDSRSFLLLLRERALLRPDPSSRAERSVDPGDDYLLSLAAAERAVLVTGDQHLLILAGPLPIHTPRTFLQGLGE